MQGRLQVKPGEENCTSLNFCLFSTHFCPIFIAPCLVFFLTFVQYIFHFVWCTTWCTTPLRLYNACQLQCKSGSRELPPRCISRDADPKTHQKKGRPASEKGYISLLWCRRPRAHASRTKSLCISDVNRPVTHCCLHRTLYHKA